MIFCNSGGGSGTPGGPPGWIFKRYSPGGEVQRKSYASPVPILNRAGRGAVSGSGTAAPSLDISRHREIVESAATSSTFIAGASIRLTSRRRYVPFGLIFRGAGVIAPFSARL